MIVGHRSDVSIAGHVGRIRLRTAVWWLACAPMFIATPLSGQAITGTVVETVTGAPIQGASVVLLNRAGERLDWFLTNPVGRFDFQLPGPGTYTLQAERIGHATVRSEAIPVDRGVTVVYTLEAPVQAIMLEGVSVSSSRRCRVRPEQGMSTATVWEEARKALEATARTTDRGLYRYVVRRYERELDDRGREVLSEQSRVVQQTAASSIRNLDVDNLLENGFVQEDRDGAASTYYAPDAEVLLSDSFLDTHCMRLTEGRGEARNLIGLSFEPTENRGITDISGVLWLDRDRGELQWVDYGYEFLDVPDSDRLGGRLQFESLPNGTWIVREWSIRMPILQAVARPGRRMRTRLVGIMEQGGLVISVSDLQGDLVLDSEAGIIEGGVFDSESGMPVPDVTITLNDATRVVADENGRFRFTDLVEGFYRLRVSDPTQESLDLRADLDFVEVAPGEVASVRLTFRSLETSLMARCRVSELMDAEGILTGFALLDTGRPARGARISVRWGEVVDRLGGLAQMDNSLTTRELGDNGFFVLCGVPTDRRVDIVSIWNGVESRPERFDLSRTQPVSRKDVTVQRDR